MADPRRVSDPELERRLADLGESLAYPPTPDLAARVRQRLEASPRSTFWAAFRPLRLAIAVATTLALVVLATLLLVPSTRTVASRLGLPGIRITYLSAVPTATPTTTRLPTPRPTPSERGREGGAAATPLPTPRPSPTPVLLGTRLNLGEEMTLDQVRSRVPYSILLPTLASLESPDAVYVGSLPVGSQVSLVYRPRPDLPEVGASGVGLLVTEFPGDVGSKVAPIGKGLGPGTRLEMVTVNGGEGYWISGQPHVFFYQDADGDIEPETLRLATNTLLWQQGSLVLRIESRLDTDAALRIAESIR